MVTLLKIGQKWTVHASPFRLGGEVMLVAPPKPTHIHFQIESFICGSSLLMFLGLWEGSIESTIFILQPNLMLLLGGYYG